MASNMPQLDPMMLQQLAQISPMEIVQQIFMGSPIIP
jgi:hypothetical protein